MRLLLAAFLLAGCSVPIESEPQATQERTSIVDEIVPGYVGGCSQGFTIYVQNQFEPFGSMIREDLDGKAKSVGLRGNEKLTATGWVDTGEVLYDKNPEGIQVRVWYYVPELPNGKGSGWLPDAGVRSLETEPAPGNADEYYDQETQSAPLPPECELLAR